MARLVFARCDEHPGFEDAARLAFPHAEFKAGTFLARGPTAYVALSVDQLDMYEGWFKGVGVRARSRLRHRPLRPGGAVFLPVTYESWLMVVDGPASLGAAVHAAQKWPLPTVVCPAFAHEAVPGAAASLALDYRLWQDRVWPM